ncbi:hypothetical protein [Nocardia pseudovaccinii]|uniref:hypothetical protein n=1 Tax=Nocardia pseudovaccinii TaxID=189540 RepID=UPI0007A3F772|nr:hypothetical protein [Nocardia pseudovaccinii]
MTDMISGLMLGLTEAERAAADRLELTLGVDLLLQHTDSGWVASLIAPDGERHSAAGDGIGLFLLDAAEKWASPVV